MTKVKTDIYILTYYSEYEIMVNLVRNRHFRISVQGVW